MPVPFAGLPGYVLDDHLAAWQMLTSSCRSLLQQEPLRQARTAGPDWKSVCHAVIGWPPAKDRAEARAAIEALFQPHEIRAKPANSDADASAFFTGYYEPEISGSLVQTPEYTEPLLARPSDLETAVAGDGAGPAAWRRMGDRREPYPTRAEIDGGAIAGMARPVAWVADAIEAFIIHIQGSARIRLPDGSAMRLTYDGRNGQNYQSVGRLLVTEFGLAPEDADMAGLKAWVRQNGQAAGEAGRTLLHRNPSYIFFKRNDALAGDAGPVGGAGIPLTPRRSLAIDRNVWNYGLPFWVDTELPLDGSKTETFQGLLMAEDTGSAIVGAARFDIFLGSGEEAGRIAGRLRHRGRAFVLLPRGVAK